MVAGIAAVFAAPAPRAAAEAACPEVTVPASVEAGPDGLTLADLLRGACPQWLDPAAQVSLGTAPRAGSVRVLDGHAVRGLLQELASAGLSPKEIAGIEIPPRIVVRRAGGTKSCAEIARFVANAASARGDEGAPGGLQQNLDCAAARGVPEEASLELTKTAWNAVLQRWEYSLRCAHSGDCVPFLVSAEQKTAVTQGLALRRLAASAEPASISAASLPVKRGQTATLIWDQAGIRVVLPVTCLDAGGLGQFVRVRFKNAPRILRAEVVGEGMLRASL
jgi:hypothetical protein